MTPAQLEIMQHTLGLNYKPVPYRNYYCVSLVDSPTLLTIRDLVAAELMAEGRKLNEGRDQYFYVTDKGKVATLAATPKRKVSRDQRRYEYYLQCKEVHEGLTFREFIDLYLKNGMPGLEGI